MSGTTIAWGRWLAPREPVFVEPTPLLAARLRARARSRRAAVSSVFVGAVVLLIAASVWVPGAVRYSDSPAVYMVKMSGFFVATLWVTWWILRGPRRAERRIAATLET